MKEKPDLRGKYPESWACVDCGINTAPGMFGREQMEQAFALDPKGVKQASDKHSEVYTVKARTKLTGITAVGRTTVEVLAMNHFARVVLRARLMRRNLFPLD